MGFNRCHLQLLRTDKRHREQEEGRLNRNVAPCSRPTSNVIGPLHECKKVCPCTKAAALPNSSHLRMNQAMSEPLSKRDRKDRTKTHHRNEKRGLPRHS